MKKGEITIEWIYRSSEENPFSDNNRIEIRFKDKENLDKICVIEDVKLSDNVTNEEFLLQMLSC